MKLSALPRGASWLRRVNDDTEDRGIISTSVGSLFGFCMLSVFFQFSIKLLAFSKKEVKMECIMKVCLCWQAGSI